MAVFAISDLHLSHASQKPMDVFGPSWDRHAERIADGWAGAVSGGDTVLLPGDISWAMRLEEAEADFAFIDALPGWKVVSKGNHDYWWTTLAKMRAFTAQRGFRSISFVHNGAAACAGGEAVVAAARGWVCPGAPGFCGDDDERLYAREAGRFSRSLIDARRIVARPPGETMRPPEEAPSPPREAGRPPRDAPSPPGEAPRLIAMLHFPPFHRSFAQIADGAPPAERCSAFMDEIAAHSPDICVYGHLHGDAARGAYEGRVGASRFVFVAADSIGFRPRKLL